MDPNSGALRRISDTSGYYDDYLRPSDARVIPKIGVTSAYDGGTERPRDTRAEFKSGDTSGKYFNIERPRAEHEIRGTEIPGYSRAESQISVASGKALRPRDSDGEIEHYLRPRDYRAGASGQDISSSGTSWSLGMSFSERYGASVYFIKEKHQRSNESRTEYKIGITSASDSKVKYSPRPCDIIGASINYVKKELSHTPKNPRIKYVDSQRIKSAPDSRRIDSQGRGYSRMISSASRYGNFLRPSGYRSTNRISGASKSDSKIDFRRQGDTRTKYKISGGSRSARPNDSRAKYDAIGASAHKNLLRPKTKHRISRSDNKMEYFRRPNDSRAEHTVIGASVYHYHSTRPGISRSNNKIEDSQRQSGSRMKHNISGDSGAAANSRIKYSRRSRTEHRGATGTDRPRTK